VKPPAPNRLRRRFLNLWYESGAGGLWVWGWGVGYFDTRRYSLRDDAPWYTRLLRLRLGPWRVSAARLTPATPNGRWVGMRAEIREERPAFRTITLEARKVPVLVMPGGGGLFDDLHAGVLGVVREQRLRDMELARHQLSACILTAVPEGRPR
jgi:hypothetical protein